MGSNGTEHIPMDEQVEGSEATIEIKIKTLDSQTYTLRVDKQMPVPALKEQIASVTGVLSEQQRLICRGKVLKDDQLLSAYHVEDGHTLHLVLRQPIPPSAEGLPDHPGTDPASSTSRHVGPGVVIETFSMPVQGDGFAPEVNRIISAVLGSIGMPNIAGGSEGIEVREHGSQRPERTLGLGGMFDFSQFQSEQAATRVPSDRSNGTFIHSTSFPLGPQPPLVIPDSLTTLTQYLSHMRCEFEAIGIDAGSNQAAGTHRMEESSNSSSRSGIRQEGLPTPASLAEVMRSTRQLLAEQVGESLLQFTSQLDNQGNVTDPAARLSTQASASRNGALFHNLGAFLLELGRTTMTLQMGQAPSDVVVNAGPAVFISPTGPNPIMVQPLPFQSGTNFGAIPMGAVQPGSGLGSGLGTGFLPRRIDIQIRRGSSATTPNATREENGETHQPSGQRNPATSSGGEDPTNQATSRVPGGSAFAGEPAVRIVPMRTMVATVPASLSRQPSDSSGISGGLYYPLLGRFQHVASGNVSSERGTPASRDRHTANLHTDQQSSESAAERQNAADSARDGNILFGSAKRGQFVFCGGSAPNVRRSSIARSVSINILSAGGTPNSQDSERQVPSSILQFIRTLFPNGEIHVEDGSAEGVIAGSVPDQARTSSGAVAALEAEPRATDEGIFLSNLLHQIMPFISQATGGEPGNSSEHRMAQESSTRAETKCYQSVQKVIKNKKMTLFCRLKRPMLGHPISVVILNQILQLQNAKRRSSYDRTVQATLFIVVKK
ncbi:ubiquitin-like domain-containing protein CIP73 isoform X3 [Pyrus x bretschneideri]|uniref:ubiquitin-like domain-containing protein CIP73 isoform X3 n=1 Tax=Pyrus x bretschneideri TaxID=225117 RepID=UPI00202E40B7|nr:ubiquitin-like domain-containing protein CIP73 isoform X3 [Pyrus x bretschneideri]